MVDSASYALSPSVGGISMDSSGTTTVSTTNAIDLTSLTVSVTTNGGAETHTSSFSVWVEDCLRSVTRRFKSHLVQILSMLGMVLGKPMMQAM